MKEKNWEEKKIINEGKKIIEDNRKIIENKKYKTIRKR